MLSRWTTSRVMGPAVVFAALLTLLISELGHRELRVLTMEREASVQTQLIAGRLRRNLLFMESATRGYLLTARPVYLEPYREQLPVFEATLQSAQQLARDPLQAQGVLGRLVELSKRKRDEMQEMIRLFEEGDRVGALLLLRTDEDQNMMAAISQMADKLIEQGAHNFSQVGELRTRSAMVSRSLIWLLVIACVLSALWVMRLARAREQEQRDYLGALQAERDSLNEDVTRQTAETVALALHMERIREDERGRLARELHDELGGLLTAAKLDVARIRKRLPEGDASARNLLLHLSHSLDAGIALKRRIIEDLRPSSLANLGLQSTLLIQCSEFAQRAEIRVTHDIDDIALSEDQALAVYRIVQEAFTNVARYASATQVHVSLMQHDDHSELQVHDNGQGFDPKVAETAGGRGLQGMKFRVKACGGELEIRSNAGLGTSVTATFPLAAVSPASD